MSRFHKILHPTDFQDKSAEAFQLACELARQNEADLIVLHVAPKGVVQFFDKVAERDAAQTHEKLWSALREKSADEKDLNVSHRFEEGTPSAVILRVAREVEADLLVVGPSKSANVPLCWLTSTTLDEIVHHAPCPVLISQPKTKSADVPTDEQLADAASMSLQTNIGPPFLP